ncbi:MAG: helix-turn-helix domain-containing protein [Sphingorhabdus sp.]|uniref:TetR/AcrR family transcriptional regulator n=1 Tax=Sphingorhabdus sp. TaxID=1902408 RepID=UPI003C9B2B75
MSEQPRRRYDSTRRAATAEETRSRILAVSRHQFSAHGIDQVTIAQIAEEAGVSASSIYALFKSKSGILRELMRASLFGERFRDAQQALAGETDAVRLIEKTAQVASAIYESELSDLGLLRGSSAFSLELREIESEFENMRLEMQSARIDQLFADKRQRAGLSKDDAKRLLWMYTSRDIFRMLVLDSGWTTEHYRSWLAKTLVTALTDGQG